MSPLPAVIFVFSSSLLFALAQDIHLSKCESQATCSRCMQELDCVWCINLRENTSNHCVRRSENIASWCDPQFVVDFQKSSKILTNDSLSSTQGNIVQITPQKLKLSLRKGEQHVLELKYKRAEDYPLDLFYIMDFSASMEPHRTKLADLGEKLANTMKTLTSNFRLGFGTFVDKVALPFTSTEPHKLNSPCTFPGGKACAAPYSYKNHLTLTNNYGEFTRLVRLGNVSGNLDNPEGGFDAIMQAIVCKNVTGWRSHARHMLVFSTDALFHIAGDGRLAGAVEPNDAQCHMVDDSYVDYLKYDYPSVSQINYIAKENNINLIFAIVNKSPGVTFAYKTLSENIESSNFGLLDQESKNVIDLVVDNYNKIVDSVTLTTTAANDVEVKITSDCNHPMENGCTNVHISDTVNFSVTIKPLKCSENESNTRKILIKPEAINEGVEIELEVLCNCPCESSSSQFFKENATECSTLGNLTCGVCHCQEGRTGFDCNCAENTNEDERCKAPNGDGKVCSGRGICKCGQCQCKERLNPAEKDYGKYCECNNYSCPRNKGLLCSNRGTCDCGECNCLAGWTGKKCECLDSNSTCIKPGTDGSICSGNGFCDCGECKCSEQFFGTFCDECPFCAKQRCNELRDCVECQMYKSGKYDESDCRLNCTTFTTIPVESIEESNENICRLSDRNGCTFSFKYEYDDKKELIVKALKEKVCIGVLNLLAWILGVIGTIVLAGLIILIIWKVCTTVHDRREYEKFEKERQELKWHTNGNPTYKAPTTTFFNPFYNRQSSSGSHRLSFKK